MLGVVMTYCASNPPDAETQRIIAARGDSVSITPCDYSTGQRNLPTNAGIHPADSSVPPMPTPYSFGSYPGQEDCQPLDSACVQRNTVREVAYQNQYYQSQADFNRQVCYRNSALNGQDTTGCDRAWPVGYAGNTPASAGDTYFNPNQQPTVPAVTDPSNPANQLVAPADVGTTNTSGAISLPSLPGGVQDVLNSVETTTGIGGSTLLLVAAAAAAFLLLKK